MNSLLGPNALLKARQQRHRRVACTLDMEVTADMVCERVRSHNLSAGGVFVDSALDYLPGMIVRLSFCVDRRQYVTRAEVIHVKPMVGFGARFLDLNSIERKHLLRFVHRERATREAHRLRQDRVAAASR